MCRFLSILSLACMALGSAQAWADVVRLDNFTYGPANVSVHVSGSFDYSGGVGGLSGTFDSASFQTYCIDLYQDSYFGVTYSNYQVIDLSAPTALSIGRLVTKYGAAVNDADTSAAFQLALWEILYETPAANYSLSSGSFTETANPSVSNLANVWLSDLGTVSNVNVQRLYSPENQDYLVQTPVPEPSTCAMLITGLGLLGFMKRRLGVSRMDRHLYGTLRARTYFIAGAHEYHQEFAV